MALNLKNKATPTSGRPHARSDPREEFTDLRAQLKIDRDRLEDDMIRQPVLYQEVSEAHVMAMSRRDLAKEEVSRVAARLAHGIRTAWNKAGEKFAEARVGDAVQLEKDYQIAFEEYSYLSARASYLGALKDSYEQRGKMLRELGQLYIAGYFGKITVSGPQRDMSDARAAAGREGMRKLRMGQEGR